MTAPWCVGGKGRTVPLGQGTTYDISYASVSSTPDVDLGVEQRAKDICVGYMHSRALLLESGSVTRVAQLPWAARLWVLAHSHGASWRGGCPVGLRRSQRSRRIRVRSSTPNEMGRSPRRARRHAPRRPSSGRISLAHCSRTAPSSAGGTTGTASSATGHTDPIGHDVNEMGDNLPAVDLGAGRTATNVFLGSDHACATLDDVSIKCWGNGGSYQLGTSGNQNIGDGPGEMGDNLPTVDLGTFCGTDERVTSENACASCAGGATNPAGDNPREYETTCACGVDEYVEQNHCTACPSGLGREGGDPVPGLGTICVESPTCRADERVSSRACVACPAGQTNDAGDATWGGDTACDRRRRARTRRTRRRSRRPSRRTALRGRTRRRHQMWTTPRSGRRRRRRTHRHLRNRRR